MSATLTEPEIALLKTTFETYTKGKGFTPATLAEIYRMAKVSITQEEIQSQFEAVDPDQSGRLDFDAFLAIMERQYQRNPEEGIQHVFEMLDSDKDGLLSRDDLQRFIVETGESVTQDELKEMVLAADVDGDGLINYEEFVKILVSIKFRNRA
ncbi:hypothetical protein EC973_007687 [Apophysomyces ossiformis]|uniref:EF-hand domain-containing protein n=1 Tax=Apophysomyces ossiformis TaxID=679940 RepID=A0A8H7BVX1_9FUNG|nr:hypothetical protein EC973_007687 [Apophysomyces ossiformis]